MNKFQSLLIPALAIIASAGFADPAVSPDGFSQTVIKKAFDTASPALVLLEYSLEITNAQTGEMSMREANSTGVIVSADGLILSQGHMVLENRRPLNIKASFPGQERKYDVTLLHKPEDINIALLRMSSPPENLPHLTFQKGKALSIGEPILLIGLLRETLDFARGIQIRRIGAVLNEPRTTYALDDAVPFGFVGGPVVNRAGEIVGLVGFDLSSQEGGELYTRSGHPLVYQTALFQKHLDAPPTEETPDNNQGDAWLGVYTQPLTDDFAEYWSLPKNGGLIVSTVIQGSPADRAGLRMGDIITSFNGRPMTAKQDPDVLGFTKLVRESPLNEPLPITLIRGGETMEIRLTLLPRPKSGREAQETEDTTFGLTVRELTTDVRIALSLPEDVDGVIVRRVRSGSPAAIGGLRPGFVILALGGRPTGSLQAFTAAVEAEKQAKNSEVTFFCRVGANTAFFRVQPRW